MASELLLSLLTASSFSSFSFLHLHCNPRPRADCRHRRCGLLLLLVVGAALLKEKRKERQINQSPNKKQTDVFLSHLLLQLPQSLQFRILKFIPCDLILTKSRDFRIIIVQTANVEDFDVEMTHSQNQFRHSLKSKLIP